jgi:hypothetical protein
MSYLSRQNFQDAGTKRPQRVARLHRERSSASSETIWRGCSYGPSWNWYEISRQYSSTQAYLWAGKSFSLYYFLFLHLLNARPVALQTDKNSVFIFVESGVYLVRLTLNMTIYDIQSHLKQLGCTEGMIALVDSNERNPSPAPIIVDSRFPFYVIQATAPRPSRWKNWVEQSSATVLVMTPWSWAEIFTWRCVET